MLFVFKNSSWCIREFRIMGIESRHLALVGCMWTLGFDFYKPFFLRKSPHLFRGGMIKRGTYYPIPSLFGELAV